MFFLQQHMWSLCMFFLTTQVFHMYVFFLAMTLQENTSKLCKKKLEQKNDGKVCTKQCWQSLNLRIGIDPNYGDGKNWLCCQ